jgi:hypothetical protein
MTSDFEIRSGRRSVSVRNAPSAQQALIDYLRSMGCRDSEIVRLGGNAISWRGARFSAVPALRDSTS